MTQHAQPYFVNNELGALKKLLIHSPDGGIGKIIPSTFSDNLYDDIVHLKKMQKEYNHYIKLLLYFLDPEKAAYVEAYEAAHAYEDNAKCYIPGKPEYFNSDYVIEIQNVLAIILQNKEVKLRLIVAICSYEESSYQIQQQLEKIEDHHLLAKTLISGVMPAIISDTGENEYIFPPCPNFIFTRDISIMLRDHVLLSKMAQSARKRESLITKYLMLYYFFKDYKQQVIEIIEESDFFLYEEKERKQRVISIEGGDVMMISPRHILIGCSERTSPNAINEVVHTIFSNTNIGIEKISVVKIPKKRAQMHIDTIFTQVKKNVWVLYGLYSERLTREEVIKKKTYLDSLTHKTDKPEEETAEIIQFYKSKDELYSPRKSYAIDHNPVGIEDLLKQVSVHDFGCNEDDVVIIYSGDNKFPHDDREQWTDSCNVVALKEGVVIGYDRNDRTAEAFKKYGFSVIHTEDLFKQFKEGILTPNDVKNTLILLPSAELSRARGGSHCMSMPLLRDNI
jgi:arginine deiminase